MIDGNLMDEVKLVNCITVTAGAAGTSAINGTPIDLAGYDGVCFIFKFGPIVAGAVTAIKVQEDTVVGMGSAADVAGTGQTVADTDDDTYKVCDIKRPLKQFLRPVVSRGTQAATVTCDALLYRPRTRPPTQPAGVAVEKFQTPAEGTA